MVSLKAMHKICCCVVVPLRISVTQVPVDDCRVDIFIIGGVVLKASSDALEIHKVLLIAFSPVITDGSPDSA